MRKNQLPKPRYSLTEKEIIQVLTTATINNWHGGGGKKKLLQRIITIIIRTISFSNGLESRSVILVAVNLFILPERR